MTYNSTHFNLRNWNITLPVDDRGNKSGTAKEVENLTNYENSNYFWDAHDSAMVFRAVTDGATTSGSRYARTELREMQGEDRAGWKLSEGGTMTATLKVDHLPRWADGSAGRMVVGQIHGEDHELIRLYYEDGTVHFVNDRAGRGNQETTYTFKNARGEQPSIGLGEKFSYLIDAHGKTLTVKIFADGQEYRSGSHINSVWQSDTLYFKAGVYLGVNDSSGSGYGQASFYGLDFSHSRGHGTGGWKKQMDAKTSHHPSERNQGDRDENHHIDHPGGRKTSADKSHDSEINGNTNNNVLNGTSHGDVIRGEAGHDVLRGGNGHDTLWGHAGNDTIMGGVAMDTIRGGTGRDTYVYKSVKEAGDTIQDFEKSEKLDISYLVDHSAHMNGLSAEQLVQQGFLSFEEKSSHDVEVHLDVDGSHGAAHNILLADLHTVQHHDVDSDIIIL